MMFKKNARPMAMIALVLGLIVMAVMEAEGYQPVTWFRTFALLLVGEWFVERGIRKRRSE